MCSRLNLILNLSLAANKWCKLISNNKGRAFYVAPLKGPESKVALVSDKCQRRWSDILKALFYSPIVSLCNASFYSVYCMNYFSTCLSHVLAHSRT